MKQVMHPLSSADTNFSPKISKFVVSRNADIDCILVHNFYLFKLSLNKHGYNFVDVGKNGYSRPSLNKDILK